MSDLARYNRYRDKIALSRSRMQRILEWKEDELDLRNRLAIYKAGQESIKAIIDCIAMIVKDEDQSPSDDYSNIDAILELERIDIDDHKALKEANGLRNRIVHENNGLNDKLAMGSLSRLIPSLLTVLEKFEKWLKNKYNI